MGQAASLAALRAGTARVRQRPGRPNVLGAVKFAMPNPMNIYLHSTSARELFGKERRDLSHGCIRVERPTELAEFMLADPSRWNSERVSAAMQPGPTRTVRLDDAIPVVLFYATGATASWRRPWAWIERRSRTAWPVTQLRVRRPGGATPFRPRPPETAARRTRRCGPRHPIPTRRFRTRTGTGSHR
ncbi:L,D-transpeptidase family protein [Massilia sp. CCM 8733]|uniref:L,D-transpeptidase family protein n=1 Tax=Massilia mucilaginosa TaxID=2609282 RepID=A0ABX0NW29_9BURK|nr:L,D-transpeptidase family protein [Massilia mucilaginosa]